MKHKRLLAALIVLALLCVCLPMAVSAQNDREFLGTATIERRANPLYEGLIDESEILSGSITAPTLDADQLYATTYVTMDKAAQQVRDAMAARKTSFEIHVKDKSSDYNEVFNRLLTMAFEHTGVPTEGDYLQWHYAYYGASLSYGTEGDYYVYSYAIEMDYYTTAAQEKELDTAVKNLLKNLNVSSKSDYQKVCAVYDYICDNITYDYDNLEDDSYTLKFSAYAALQNKTAVCQGYALLFYRLMLELDVDARLIAGDGGGPHAWNIVKLGDVYYNLDSTWDAGYDDYYYFLLNSENFSDHARYLDYMTTQFHTDYPMSATDYVDGVEGEPEYFFVVGGCGDNAYFGVNRDRELVIAGEGATFDDYEIDEMGIVVWHYWADGFDTVIVEEGITRLGECAFADLDNVTEIIFPETLREIGYRAFQSCDGLKTIQIPDGVTVLGEEAFSYNPNLTEVTVGGGLTDIGRYAFYKCGSLKKVTFQEGLTHLGESMFEECTALTTVTFPASLTDLGSTAFKKTGLTTVTVPDTVTNLGRGTFMNCGNLTSVTLGDGITLIGDEVFEGCSKLSSVNMSDNVTKIGWYSFGGCSSLKKIELSAGLENIHASAFQGAGLTEVDFPDGLQYIGHDSFRGCTGLTEITIPSSVTNLGGFYDCTNLKKVNFINPGVETIEGYAFYGCTSLESFEIPDTVKEIGDAAFQKCTSLKEMIVPESVTNFESGFPGCTSLETVYLNHQGALSGYAYSGCTALKNVYISENITEIEVLAFTGCSALEKIEIPGSVRIIGDRIFEYCSNLKEIRFGGEAPSFAADTFATVAASAYYPGDLASWTGDVLQDYGGDITWVSTHTHSYTSSVVAPTCTEQGYTLYTCECGDSYKDNYVAALGHEYGEAVFDKAIKSHVSQCGVCGEKLTESCAFDAGTVVREATMEKFGITEYTCTVCGGSYDAETVYRVFGAGRSETAIAAAEELKAVLGIEKFDSIILAGGEGFADALAGSYLAVQKDAPILLVRASTIELNKNYVLDNLAENGTVYILGGPAAVPQEMEDALEGLNVVRLQGDDRFQTNLKILEEAGIDDEEILICTGWNFADSLSASAAGLPILMLNTSKNELTADQVAFLEKYADNEFTIIGGTAAVSEKLEADVEAIVGDADRVSGSTREETSVKVAKRYFSVPDYAVVAYSRNFPDGLCGGPLAHALRAPLLLVNVKCETPAADYIESQGITQGFVLGGTAAVSEDSARIVFDLK